ncbi:MAG: hypothetical protein ACFFD4_34320 [Candidatus Odinarchaeota archaeon]
MNEILDTKADVSFQEDPLTLKSRALFPMLFAFVIILAVEILGFTTLRLQIARALGEAMIAVDFGSVAVMIFGALSISYYYYTRYAKRELILSKEGFTLKVGHKNVYEYTWSEFSLVALSLSYSATGTRGYLIRLFENDLEGEYVDLPLYRFSKKPNVFDLRSQIVEMVRLNQSKTKDKRPIPKSS